jgi:hypothetical protein
VTDDKLPLTAVAMHEAGHAVAAIKLGVPFLFVSIQPGEDGSYGRVRTVPGQKPSEAMGRVCLGGVAAQLAFGRHKIDRAYLLSRWESDLKKARACLETDDVGPHLAEMVETMKTWAGDITTLATELLIHTELDYDQVRGLLDVQ